MLRDSMFVNVTMFFFSLYSGVHWTDGHLIHENMYTAKHMASEFSVTDFWMHFAKSADPLSVPSCTATIPDHWLESVEL